MENQRSFMNQLGLKLGYTTMEDWYKITQADFAAHKGTGLIRKYNGTSIDLLQSVFPEHAWNFWMFKNATKGLWSNLDNQRLYMAWLGERLGYERMGDWYRVTNKDFLRHSGDSLLRAYGSSPSTVLENIFPDYSWLPWKFPQGKRGLWDTVESHKKYMDWLGEKLGYTCNEDWYQVTRADFENNYGCTLLQEHYTSCISRLLETVYPDFKWQFWKKSVSRTGFWNDISNQKEYIEWLYNTLGFTDMTDWYYIRQKHFKDNYGSFIFDYYNGSPYQLLTTLYSDYDWKFWMFHKAPLNIWDDIEKQKEYMTWLGNKLGYKTMEDWYKVSLNDFNVNHGGGGFFSRYNSCPYLILKGIYPVYPWKKTKFRNTTSKVSLEWIAYIEKTTGLTIQHGGKDEGEYRIPGTRLLVDGFCSETNTVYEFHGSYFHGAPHLFNPSDINVTCKKTYGELYRNTIERENVIRSLGYNLVVIWEYEWTELKKTRVMRARELQTEDDKKVKLTADF
jgi:hypothetical protein